MYNHNKAQQSKNRVHISWDVLHLLNIAPIFDRFWHSLLQQLSNMNVIKKSSGCFHKIEIPNPIVIVTFSDCDSNVTWVQRRYRFETTK